MDEDFTDCYGGDAGWVARYATKQEYTTYGVNLSPMCNDFTTSNRSRGGHMCPLIAGRGALLLLLALVFGGAVQPEPFEGSIDAALQRFKASDWTVRAKAFYEFLDLAVPGGFNGRTWMIPAALHDVFHAAPGRADRAKAALASLLRTENAVALQTPGSSPRMSEEQANYYGDLLAAVAALHDARALEPLLEALSTGNIATRGIAAFGSAALDRVLTRFDSGNSVMKTAATRTLSQMLEPANVSQVQDHASRSKLTRALLRAGHDQDPSVRIAAVEGLAALHDQSATSLLVDLAEHDPFVFPAEPGQSPTYPVRRAARRVLDSPR